MRKTVNRLADSAASIGYQNGWRDAHGNLTPRMAEMEDLIGELALMLKRVMHDGRSMIGSGYRSESQMRLYAEATKLLKHELLNEDEEK